ncbi:hypothetical protein BH23BAC1_BH23BAC1_46530 [soil metagenome]
MSGTNQKKLFVHYLPVYGCVSTGIIYLAIGVIAILSFLKLKEGGADEGSVLAYLNNYLTGKILVWIILLGTISYIIWRIYETYKDPYGYGKDAKGIAKRTGIALSTIADAFIAYTAIQVLLGAGNIQEDGQPYEQQQIVGNILQEDGGNWLIIGIGAVICLTSLVQFFYGVTRGYRERLDIDHFSSVRKTLTHILAWAGYSARGIILGIMGFFFIKAGIVENAKLVVNTDKAFDFIGDHVGHVYFILVAVGTICYGIFMFAQGVTYNVEKN